jgi:hypothetical protein
LRPGWDIFKQPYLTATTRLIEIASSGEHYDVRWRFVA